MSFEMPCYKVKDSFLKKDTGLSWDWEAENYFPAPEIRIAKRNRSTVDPR